MLELADGIVYIVSEDYYGSCILKGNIVKLRGGENVALSYDDNEVLLERLVVCTLLADGVRNSFLDLLYYLLASVAHKNDNTLLFTAVKKVVDYFGGTGVPVEYDRVTRKVKGSFS